MWKNKVFARNRTIANSNHTEVTEEFSLTLYRAITTSARIVLFKKMQVWWIKL